jgi:ABC-2 type transport system permease protein
MGLPVLIGLAMELSSFLDVPLAWRRVLLAPAFTAWHGLVTEHAYYGPLVSGTAISGAYFVGSLAVAYRMVRRRDMGR